MSQDPIKRNRIGRTSLEVPAICFGMSPIGSVPEIYGHAVADEQARATVRAVLDGPVKFLDTSRNYGAGRSETRIGEVLRERGGAPADLIISTKLDRDPETNVFDASAARRSLERSLKALGVDRVQILHLHDPEYAASLDDVTKKGGALDELFRMKEEGIADAIGLAAGRIDIMMPIIATRDLDCLITHNRYMLTNRNAEPLIELAVERGISVLNAAPYAGGVLAKGSEAMRMYVYQEATDETLEPVRRIEAICAQYGVPVGAAALQFSMRDARVASTIVGVSRPERVVQTLEWAGVKIGEAVWEELLALPFDTGDPEASRGKPEKS